jgi:hypothetical protein
MLKTFKRAFVTVAAFAIVLQAPLSVGLGKVKAQEVPPVATAYSSISVTVDNQKYYDLFNFTTELQNDPLWFPNVGETVLIQEGGPNLVGRKYIQRSYFNGIPLDSTVEVKSAMRPFYYYIEGAGPVATYKALYTFNPTYTGAGKFTLTTEFTAPGITAEAMTYMLNLAMQNILTHFQSTGTIHMNFLYIV